jgi:hypothetical protein
MKRHMLLILVLAPALALASAASASASIFDVQAVTVTDAGTLNIFATAACPPTHERYALTVTVSQRGRHHTVNEAVVSTEQLGVCTDPPTVYPFWLNGLCGGPIEPCPIGSGFHPGRARVTWSGRTFAEIPGGLPPAEETGSTRLVIRRACGPASGGRGPGAARGGGT